MFDFLDYMDKNRTGQKTDANKPSQVYFGGIPSVTTGNTSDGFGHGHQNNDTGYIRPPVQGSSIQNTAGWTGIMGSAGKRNIDVGDGG